MDDKPSLDSKKDDGENVHAASPSNGKQSAKVEISEKSETLPGWTIMRPLRMRGLKGKKDGDAKDVKTMSTDSSSDGPNGAANIDVLDVRSDDGLLDGNGATLNGGDSRDMEASVSGGSVEYKSYKRRWFGLAQLVLLNIVVSWDWLTFSASSTTASEYYGISPTALNWLATGFLFAFVVASPLVLFTLHRGGPRLSIIIASCLLLVGNWIRYAGTRAGPHGNFGTLMFGQILTGLAQPFVLAAPTRYSDLWFSNKGRVAATAIMSLANPLGGAVAQLVGPEIATTSGDIPFLVLIVSIVATVACVPSFFIPAGPPTPASASAHTPKEDILPSLRSLSTHPEFYMIMIPFVFYVSLFNSFSSLINQFLQPYSYSETQAGIAGALLIVVGLVAAAISSPIIDKKKCFLLAIKIQVPIIALSYLAFTWAPQARSEIAIYVILAILGASSFSLMPVALEYVIEVTHPVSPEVTSTICWTGGQLLGGVFIIISGELRAPGKTDGSEDDGTTRPPANMYNALVFQTVLALLVVPLPMCLGLFGRAHGVRLRRVQSDNEAAARGAAAIAAEN